MPFFPQAYLPEAALFQLLSELDAPQQQKQQQPQQHPACVRRTHRPQTFTPRFDVVETAEAYQLHGEVPGLQQSDLDIQFSDAQTLIIKGKTERAVHTTPAPAPVAAAEPEQAQATQVDDDSSSERSHTATVEDDYDEADTPLVTPASTSSLTPTAAEKGKAPESSSTTAAAPTQAQVPQSKYWVAERRVGEFARSFSFEQRIEQDFVTANLQNGILSVVVPKSLKSKRVAVSVL